MKKELNLTDEELKLFNSLRDRIDNRKKQEEKKKMEEEIPIPPVYIPNTPVIDNKIKLNGNDTLHYIFIFSIYGASIGTALITYFNASTIIFFIMCLILIPIIILTTFALVGKLFINRKRIKSGVIKKFSNNYIIAYIFGNSRRLKEQAFMLNADGKTFSDGDKEYTVESKAIWINDKKQPCSYYLENLPNPIVFPFLDNLGEYVNMLIKKQTVTNETGQTIDVSYSSENLKLLKKDKIFSELHRDPETNKIIMLLIGLIALAFIVIVIILLVRK